MTQHQVLSTYFGYKEFRPGQEPLIKSILSGQDVLGIMPTGAGKSICYQVPALMLTGITLVVSPLISLMKDQVSALNQAGVHAAYINSSLNERQIAKALSNAANGQYKIIYVAPERLETSMFLEFARNAKISMLTIDEAHCISQWGQDFRPSYLKIVDFVNSLPVRPIISAFTATATKEVKEDIACILGLQNAYVQVMGFDRANLFYEVRTPQKKMVELENYLEEHQGESGVIYCATRKNVDKIYEALLERGLPVTRYHAGLSNEERQINQDAFIYDEKPIMVATNAFGMGIDKSNVRFVVHFNMPQSLENYYQEAGRAGRDGEPSECIMLYSPQDIIINQMLLESSTYSSNLTPEDALLMRDRDGYRLNKMIEYCLTKQCLRTYILRYFGEDRKDECGNCGNCLAEYEMIDISKESKIILQFVQESRQRYGARVIIGALRGETYAKLRSYGVEQFPSYGLLKESSEYLLNQILNFLVVEGYLFMTKDKYSLIKLTQKPKEILQFDKVLTMKYYKEPEKEHVSKVKHSLRSDILTTKGLELFDELRTFRMEIAMEEHVPPYIVFSDKTLTDMCIKLPKDREEMLQVSGVGENKFEKYGERFLRKIQETTNGDIEGYYFEGASLQTQEEEKVKRSSSKKKEAFQLTKEMADELHFTENGPITELTNQMNELRDETKMKKITAISIIRKLMEEGYLEEVQEEKITTRTVFQKGEEYGISLVTKTAQSGRFYKVFYFTELAQKDIVRRLLEGWKLE